MTAYYTPADEAYCEQMRNMSNQTAAKNLGMCQQAAPLDLAGLEKACDPAEQERIWRLICETSQA